MGRSPCCAKEGLNRGAWTAMEDKILTDYIQIHGEGKWRNLPKRAGLKRCGKSCRLRWLNYLRPGIKRGNITQDEEELIIRLHKLLGNRWSLIAGRLPGRTDNEIKNYWNTNIGKKLQNSKISSSNHNPLNQSQQKPNPTINKSSSSLNTEPKKVFWAKASRCSKVVNIPIASPLSKANFSVNGDSNKWKLNSEEYYNNSSELLLDFEMDEFLLSDLFNTDNFSPLNNFNYNNSNSNKNLLILDDPMQDSEFSFMDSFLTESGEFNWNIQDQVLLGNEDGEKEQYNNKN